MEEPDGLLLRGPRIRQGSGEASSIHLALAIAVSRASRLSGFIAAFSDDTSTIPFTAAKIGAVQGSVVMVGVVADWSVVGSLRLGSAVETEVCMPFNQVTIRNGSQGFGRTH